MLQKGNSIPGRLDDHTDVIRRLTTTGLLQKRNKLLIWWLWEPAIPGLRSWHNICFVYVTTFVN